MSAVVIGAGVAGLAAAHRLARAGEQVSVLEASDRAGGMVSPLTIAGQVIDGGAEAYARRQGIADELCATLGLEVAAPAGTPHIRWSSSEVWPAADGVLGIPSSPDDPALAAALTPDELAVAQTEPALDPNVGFDADTVADLVAARLGQAVVDRLVTPITRGVYGMAPDTMPLGQFAPALRGPGSLYAKVAAARGARSSVAQPVGGLIRLVEALVADIEAHGGRIQLATRVQRLEREWLSGRVVVACPARPAVSLLGEVGVSVEIPATVAALSAVLAIDGGHLPGDPVGSGVLLGQPIPGLGARALTHYSAKWPWSRGGAEVLRLSYAPDAAPTYDQALSDASILVGCAIPEALDFAVVRWPQVPRALAPAARTALRESLPAGITVAGAWVAGNGIEAAIASGLEAAA